jgi:hypothetical protein
MINRLKRGIKMDAVRIDEYSCGRIFALAEEMNQKSTS